MCKKIETRLNWFAEIIKIQYYFFPLKFFTDKQTDKSREDRQKYRQTHIRTQRQNKHRRHTEAKTGIHKDTKSDRRTEAKTDIHKDTKTDRHTYEHKDRQKQRRNKKEQTDEHTYIRIQR